MNEDIWIHGRPKPKGQTMNADLIIDALRNRAGIYDTESWNHSFYKEVATLIESQQKEIGELKKALTLAISKYSEIANGIADAVNKRRTDSAFEKIGQTMPHDSPID